MSEFKNGDRVIATWDIKGGVRKTGEAIVIGHDWWVRAGEAMPYRDYYVVLPVESAVSGSPADYKMARNLTPVPITTPAEQAVYDRIERVLDALGDAYGEAGYIYVSSLWGNRNHQAAPAFAALLEAKFTEEA